jgi:hypothetical protein
MASIKEFSSEIMGLIGQDKIKEAILKTQDLLKGSSSFTDLILQSARFNRIEKEIQRGLINYEAAAIEKNKVVFALMNILQDLEELSDNNQGVKNEVESYLKEQEASKVNQISISGNQNINIQDLSGGQINIQTGNSESTDNKDIS